MSNGHEEFSASWQGKSVDAASVERALARLLNQMNPPSREGEIHPPARTSVLSLIVRAPDPADEARAIEALGDLAERHPSRTLVVAMDPTAEPGLDAAVSAHCNIRPGSQARVCFEEIRLTARGGIATSLGSVVAPLLIPDLPVFLWWLGDQPEPEEGLLLLSDRLIVDSTPLGPEGLIRLENLAGELRGRVPVSDLAWSALGPWRELLAQLFDPPEARPYQHKLSKVQLQYCAGGPVARPLLLLGWLAGCLGWGQVVAVEPDETDRRRLRLEGQNAPAEVYLYPAPCPGRLEGAQVLGVTLVAEQAEQEATFTVEREQDQACAAVRTALPERASTAHTVPLTLPSLAALLGEELEPMARDPLYQESQAWAAAAARRWR